MLAVRAGGKGLCKRVEVSDHFLTEKGGGGGGDEPVVRRWTRSVTSRPISLKQNLLVVIIVVFLVLIILFLALQPVHVKLIRRVDTHRPVNGVVLRRCMIDVCVEVEHLGIFVDWRLSRLLLLQERWSGLTGKRVTALLGGGKLVAGLKDVGAVDE